MGRQLNQIIEGLSAVTGATSTINVNLDAIEALLTTLQADVADGLIVTNSTGVLTNGTVSVTGGTITSGTVTANVFGQHQTNENQRPIPVDSWQTSRFNTTVDLIVPVQITNDSGTLNASNPLPISGTVTANLEDPNNVLDAKISDSINGSNIASGYGFVDDAPPPRVVQIGFVDEASGNMKAPSNTNPLPISGTVTANGYDGSNDVYAPIPLNDGANAVRVRIDETNGSLPVSGTVTATPTRSTTTTGTLTAGTTNGTLFASNATRNYLLVQCTSGTAFIDTNGTATAANGIQLTSGQGITFEGSFIPTGAIAGITSTSTAQLIGREG